MHEIELWQIEFIDNIVFLTEAVISIIFVFLSWIILSILMVSSSTCFCNSTILSNYSIIWM